MDITAKQTYVRQSQQKLRDVARAVKALPVATMRTQLTMMNKEAAKRILQTLDQAVANAKHNHGVSEDKLAVKELLILRGPHYKRFRAVSRGMAHSILKRTSHIVITLSTVEEKTKQIEKLKPQSSKVKETDQNEKAEKTKEPTKEVKPKTKKEKSQNTKTKSQTK